MSGFDKLHNVVSILTDSFRVDEAALDDLRHILEKEHQREVSRDEAEAFGRNLITVVETLANGKKVTVKKDERHAT